jgi:hypothetical protein
LQQIPSPEAAGLYGSRGVRDDEVPRIGARLAMVDSAR